MNLYEEGEDVTLFLTAKLGSILTDPDTISLSIKPPAEPAYNATPSTSGVGLYNTIISAIIGHGLWVATWTVEKAGVTGVKTHTFRVRSI